MEFKGRRLGMGERGQALVSAGGWWLAAANLVWSHRLLFVVIGVSLVGSKSAIRSFWPDFARGFGPHVEKLGDACGERLDLVAEKIRPKMPHARPVVDKPYEQMVLAVYPQVPSGRRDGDVRAQILD